MVFTVGLIGLGRIGLSFELDSKRSKPASHLGALKALRNQFTLQYVCDVNPSLQSRAEEVYGSPLKFIDKPIDILDEKVDVAVVATPPETHFSIAKLLAENGGRRPRLIFVEKPLCDKLFDAADLAMCCKQSGVGLAVNHSRRWDPLWRRVKKMVDDGEIGELKMFTGVYTGAPMNVGVHMADLVNWFNPDYRYVHNLTYARSNDYLVFEVDLWGREGRIHVRRNGSFFDVEKPSLSPYYSDTYELTPSSSHHYFSSRGDTPMLNAYLNILNRLESGEPLACDGDDGVKAIKTVEEWIGTGD